MSTWQCASHAAARASSYQFGLICLYGTWAPGWNSDGGQNSRVLAKSHCSGDWVHSHLSWRHSFTDSQDGLVDPLGHCAITGAFSW